MVNFTLQFIDKTKSKQMKEVVIVSVARNTIGFFILLIIIFILFICIFLYIFIYISESIFYFKSQN